MHFKKSENYPFKFIVALSVREVCVWSLFCCVVCSVLSSFATIPLGMNALVALLLLVFLLSRSVSLHCSAACWCELYDCAFS